MEHKVTVLNRWKGPVLKHLPRVYVRSHQNTAGQSRYVLDADFLRMQNFQIGYALLRPGSRKLAQEMPGSIQWTELFHYHQYPKYNADTLEAEVQ